MLLIQLVVIVFKYVVKGLGFPKCERQPLLYPLGRPRIMLLFQLVVIVFKHSVKGLGFPKCERQPLLYPPEQTSNNVVGSIGCHRVQICCKGSWFS